MWSIAQALSLREKDYQGNICTCKEDRMLAEAVSLPL